MMQSVAQAGTAEMAGAQGCGHSGPSVMVGEAVVVVVGGSGSGVVVVEGSGSGVVVGSQDVTGEAVTQLQTAVTDLATSRAGRRPQAPITQSMA